MSSANSTIQYNSLETNEIRLLLLLPGSGDEAICCKLMTVELQSAGYEKVPVYHALSNVWGRPQPTSRIYISRAPSEVRGNLLEALKQVLYIYFPRYLWVDAICSYVNRYQRNCHRSLRFGPVSWKGFFFIWDQDAAFAYTRAALSLVSI
jgi:hypothetical protein